LLSNVQITELVKKGKESKERKFPESVEAFLTFRDVDPKKTDLNINEMVYLPHPGSHRASVCFVGSGDLLLRAKNAKVDGAIEPAQLESYAGNKKEAKNLARQYDFFLADTALMPRIGRILGQYLGPRDGMPTAQPWYRSNSTSGTSCLLSRNTSSGSLKNSAATRTRPRSRILRQMTECAQCST